MSKLKEKLVHLLPQIQTNTDGMTISDQCKVEIKCNCGATATVSARNLTRKYADKPYQCKSCSVKTYANDPQRIEKFRETFSKTASTPEHKEKCSKAGAKAWENPETRARITEAVRLENKRNPSRSAAGWAAIQKFMEKHGKEHCAKMRAMQDGKPSMLEMATKRILEHYNVEYTAQYKLGYYSFDFFLPKHNILLEINGEYWHAETQAKDSAKAQYGVNAGHIVKHIWENDFSQINKVESLIKQWTGIESIPNIEFDFNELTIKEIDNKAARVFLGAYHYLPAISKSGYHIGAFLKDKLIASITFSHTTRVEIASRMKLSSTVVREIGRFCIAPGYHKRNFASWFMSKAIGLFKTKHQEVTRLISFADTTIHDGGIYKASNWKPDGATEANYMYRSPDGYLAHKKTIWDRASKVGMTESDYTTLHNYMKVWSKPKNRYILDL